MDEFDENGWAHVHHAAYNGYYKSVSRFIKSREDQLELETQDGQQLTPFGVHPGGGGVLPQILDRGVPRRFLNPNPI